MLTKNDKKLNILLGVTGSVATILIEKIKYELECIGNVKIISTEKSFNFSPPNIDSYTDQDEWDVYTQNKSVLHVDLRKWADVFVVAPLSVSSLGKIANGISDNLLTCTCLAWDFSKPIIVAPSCNTMMFTNPTTQRNLKTLTDMGYVVVPPIRKVLACGDDGIGAMAQIESIIQTVKNVTTPWVFPLTGGCPGIPVGSHPGAFGVKRKHDFHTGVDLYCKQGDFVFSCTDGVVVEVKPFTGPSIGHTWWNETKAIVIDTGMNYILYGEVESLIVKVGDKVKRGQMIAKIIPVLPEHKYRPDIPGHSVNMLHLELMRRNPVFTEFQGRNGFMTWDLDKCQPYDLFNPTSKLMTSERWSGQVLDYLK